MKACAAAIGFLLSLPGMARGDAPQWRPLGQGVEHLALASGEIVGHAFRFRLADVELHVVPAPEGRARVQEIATAPEVIATNASFFDEAVWGPPLERTV